MAREDVLNRKEDVVVVGVSPSEASCAAGAMRGVVVVEWNLKGEKMKKLVLSAWPVLRSICLGGCLVLSAGVARAATVAQAAERAAAAHRPCGAGAEASKARVRGVLSAPVQKGAAAKAAALFDIIRA